MAITFSHFQLATLSRTVAFVNDQPSKEALARFALAQILKEARLSVFKFLVSEIANDEALLIRLERSSDAIFIGLSSTWVK